MALGKYYSRVSTFLLLKCRNSSGAHLIINLFDCSYRKMSFDITRSMAVCIDYYEKVRAERINYYYKRSKVPIIIFS